MVIVTVITVSVTIAGFGISADKMEKIDCYKWQEYKRDFSRFEVSDRMELQCYSHGIDVWKYEEL